MAVVIHLAGFPEQRELLSVAGVMAQSPHLNEVALTRVGEDEAWLTVRAESVEEVATAVAAMPGFNLQAHVDQNQVEARRIEAPGADHAAIEELLPQRPRFRAFRPQTEAPAEGTERTALPAPQTPQAPAAAALRRVPAPRPVPDPAAERPMPPVRPTGLEAPAARQAPRTPATPATPHATQPATAQPPLATPTPPAAAPARPVSPQPSPVPAAEAPRSSAPARPSLPPQIDSDDRDFVEPDDRPGGAVMTVEHMTLMVYPFHSFAALNEFQAAIRGLHGVKNIRVRRFHRGTLHLAVDYEDMIPLVDRMADLRDVEYAIASESRSELELVLQDHGSLDAAGDN